MAEGQTEASACVLCDLIVINQVTAGLYLAVQRVGARQGPATGLCGVRARGKACVVCCVVCLCLSLGLVCDLRLCE